MSRACDEEQDRDEQENCTDQISDSLWDKLFFEFLEGHRPDIYGPINTSGYKRAFNKWMKDWKPDAFVTVNLPHERHRHRMLRDAQFYLNLWTRRAEAAVLGTRTLKDADYERRLVWLFRREEAADGLIHYHGIVKFPAGRPWESESGAAIYDPAERCQRLQDALKRASARTPEPFTMKFPTRVTPALQRPISSRPRLVKKSEPPREPTPFAMTRQPPRESADIDVRPYDLVYHAPYLLKGLWNSVPNGATDESTWTSGLIILPHLPKKGMKHGNSTANA